MADESRWNILLILPNLSLGVDSPFITDSLAICSAADGRLNALADTPANQTAIRMLKAFRNWFNKPHTPSCLLVRTDAPAALSSGTLLRSFRNVCALATTSYCSARTITGSQWLPRYADFFFFAAHVPAKNGSIQNLHSMVEGLNDDVDGFQGQSAGQIDLPHAFSVDYDRVLLRRLMKAWDSHYLRVPTDPDLVALFRSLEVALQANRFPSDGISSLSDVGTRIGLWVSAFEVLFHPGGNKSVNKRVVQQALERVALSDARLRRRTYTSVWGRPPLPHKVNFSAYVYDELYRARNAFMHGNPVEPRDLNLRRRHSGLPLLVVAPILYNVALRSYTKSMFAASDDDQVDDFFIGENEIREALLVVRTGQPA